MNERLVGRVARAATVAGLLSLALPALAQEQAFPIWPGAAPGSEKWTRKEVITGPGNQRMVRNVVRPTLTPYLPKPGTANGAAVVIAPGGAFRFLSWDNEGTKVAEWLSARGVTAFVLKYRLVNTGATEAEFQKSMQELFQSFRDPGDPFEHPETKQVAEMGAADGRQAVKVVRRQAAKWGISTKRVGILGFSAGAVVATRVGIRHDAASRPDFVGAIYGAPMQEFTVPADAPPLFVLFAKDDGISVGATQLYKKWKDAGKPAELVTYEKGGHGFGMSKRGQPTDDWIERFRDWLGTQDAKRATSRQESTRSKGIRNVQSSSAPQKKESPPPVSSTKAEQEVITLSREKWRWMSERNVDSLAALFHERAVFVHMGGTMSRNQELDVIRSGGIHYKNVEIQEASVRLIGTTAILLNTIRLVAVVGGNEVTNPFVVTEVYVQQSGAWKLASLSFTRTLR